MNINTVPFVAPNKLNSVVFGKIFWFRLRELLFRQFPCNPRDRFRVFPDTGDKIPVNDSHQRLQTIMKRQIRYALGLAVLSVIINTTSYAQNKSPGYVDFGKFSPPTAGGEFVEVHIKNNLISMVARLVEKEEPDVAELLRGLQLVRVNVIGLDDGNRAEMETRVKKIRDELDAQGWERVVTAQKKDEDVGVYLKTRGEEAVEGVVVTVLDGKREAVLINIVGNIKPEKIALIGERLNIDPLKKIGKAIEKK